MADSVEKHSRKPKGDVPAAKPEVVEPGVLATPKKRRPVRVTDIIIFAVLAIVIVALSITLYDHVVLKRDVAAAKVVSTKVVADIQKRDGAAARALGTPNFQKTYSDARLTTEFKNVELATLKPPALDRQIAYTGPHGRTVFFIYKYTALKVPFYVQVGVVHLNGHWQLTDIAGSDDESSLIIQ